MCSFTFTLDRSSVRKFIPNFFTLSQKYNTTKFPYLEILIILLFPNFYLIIIIYFILLPFRATRMVYGSSQSRVESELQLPAYTTATAMWDLSLLCNLHHSSRQRPGSKPASSWILSGSFHRAQRGLPPPLDADLYPLLPQGRPSPGAYPARPRPLGEPRRCPSAFQLLPSSTAAGTGVKTHTGPDPPRRNL